MKPKDLCAPFTWDNRTVRLDSNQKIFYVPPRCLRPVIHLSLNDLFRNEAPIHLEYCSGNGDWICEKAKNFPDVNWIALEKKFGRVRKIASKMNNQRLSNLFIFCGEAHDITSHYIPKNSLSKVYINFPDPWPKRKHSKNRLIKPSFLDMLSLSMKKGGEVFFVTDYFLYSKQVIQYFNFHSYFSPLFSDPYYQKQIDQYGDSFFYNLWLKKKASFYFSKFKKH